MGNNGFEAAQIKFEAAHFGFQFQVDSPTNGGYQGKGGGRNNPKPGSILCLGRSSYNT